MQKFSVSPDGEKFLLPTEEEGLKEREEVLRITE